MKTIFIYALKDPETKQIRYIGRTKYPNQRLYEHHQIKRLKNKTHKNNWIMSLINKGLKAELEILEKCNENNWSEREKYWIADLPNLTNTTKGGEGEFEMLSREKSSQETRDKIAETVSKLHADGIYKNSYELLSKSLQGRKKEKSSSIYVGVFKCKSGTFGASIRFRSKIIRLGTFKEEKDAAIAYDIKAFELFGNEARLNFPELLGKVEKPKSYKDLLSSKHTGIRFCANRWQALLFINGKHKYLGRYLTEEEAVKAKEEFLNQNND